MVTPASRMVIKGIRRYDGDMNLATCTYQEVTPDMGIPVRTTVGAPRFKLAYQLAGHAKLITPTRPMLGLPRGAYEVSYRGLLNAAGAERIHAELAAIHAAAGRPAAALVLLCFDRLDKPGEWCHRSMFADWWLEHTGQEVPELGATPGVPAAEPAPKVNPPSALF